MKITIAAVLLTCALALAGSPGAPRVSGGPSGGSGGSSYTDSQAVTASGWYSDGGSTATTQTVNVNRTLFVDGGTFINSDVVVDGGFVMTGKMTITGASGSTAVRINTGQYFALNASEGAYVRAPANNGTTIVGDTLNVPVSYQLNGRLFASVTNPSVSGFGTSPSITANNGTIAFSLDVGTGGTASTGTIVLPTATNGWRCSCDDVTTPASFITSQTGGSTTSCTVSNYSRTTGLIIAWTASDVLRCSALAY